MVKERDIYPLFLSKLSCVSSIRSRIIYNRGMKNEIGPRIGTFFILIGCVLLMLFVGSILGRDTNFIYLLCSATALFFGYLFRRSDAPPEPMRFSTIRKVNQRARQRREEKQGKKDQRNVKTNPPFRGNI